MVDYADESLFLQDSVDKQISIISDDQTINISNDDIVGEEFELTESLCSEDNLCFGTVESSCIRFRVKNTFPKMKKKWLTVTITSHGAEEPFTIGRYYVRNEKPSSDRSTKEITAYDGMYSILQNTYLSWYKTAFDETRQTTVKDFRDAFFERLAETHPWISQEEVSLTNDNIPFKRVKKLNRHDLSGQNILKAICEINGVCGRLGRDNVFHYYGFDNTQNPYVLTKTLTISADYEDYTTTTIDRIEYRSEKGTVYAQAGVDSSSANNTYVVESNFLIRGIERERAVLSADRMLYVVNQSGFTPIDAEFKGNPCYEVGDYIQFTANGNNIKSFIMQRRMKGIQSLHDFYTSQGKKEYPVVSTTHTAKIKTNSEKIGTVEKSDYSFVSNLDGEMENIGYSDSDCETVSISNVDPEYEGRRTMHYWVYNQNLAEPRWTTWRGVVKDENMPFVVCAIPNYISGQRREVNVAGKLRKDTMIILVGRIIGYAGSVLSQYPIDQEYKYVSGLVGGQQFAFSDRWNNMYSIGVTSKEYWYTGSVAGTPITGLIDEDTPADYEYDSLNDIVAAINNGDLVVDDDCPSDYKMKLPTQSSANTLNKALGKLNDVLSTGQNSGNRSLRSSVVSESEEEPEFIVGTDIMNDNNIKKVAETIGKIANTVKSNVNNIIESFDNESRLIAAKLMDGVTRKIANIPTFIATIDEPADYHGVLYNNSLLFNLGTNSEIEISEKSNGEHDWSFGDDGFSFDELGWWFNTLGNRDSSLHENQYCTFEIDGLTQGSTHTFTLAEYVQPYSCERSFIIWSYNHVGGGYEIHQVTIKCNVPFVVSCFKYSNDNYQFTYNGQSYTKNPYWIQIVVNAGSSGTPTITYTDSIIQQEETEYNIAWNTSPVQPLQWRGTNYYLFSSMEGSTVFGMLNDADMDYVYANETALAEGIENVRFSHNFVNGKPIGILFSDSATVSDFSNLPTNRGTWNSAAKFHSFYADGNWHDLTCQFIASADTMYAHLILNGLADCAESSQTVDVKLKGFIETSIEYGIKKLYGRWGNRWYRYLAEGGGGSSVNITPNYSAGIDVADYAIDGVGGSIYVPIEANPAETGSTNLTKLKIGTNVYNVPSGGGGGYTETVLYDGLFAQNGELELSDDIGNYDELIIWVGWTSITVNGRVPFRVDVSTFKTYTYAANPTAATDHVFCLLYSNQYLRIARASVDTKIRMFDAQSGAIEKVIGIKY